LPARRRRKWSCASATPKAAPIKGVTVNGKSSTEYNKDKARCQVSIATDAVPA